MKKDQSFHDYVVHDVLRNIPDITSQSMFGGWGVYKDGIIFAIIAGSELYFKVDDSNRSDFEKFDSHPFIYSQGKNKQITMSYWLLPEDIMENETEIPKWVERSVQISIKNRPKTKKNKR